PVPQVGSRAFPRDFQTGGGNCQDRVNTMAPYIRVKTARSYGWSIGTGTENGSGNQQTQMTGRKRSGNCASGFRPGTTRSLRSSGKESSYNLRSGSISFWRTTQNLRSAHQRPTRRTSEPGCT